MGAHNRCRCGPRKRLGESSVLLFPLLLLCLCGCGRRESATGQDRVTPLQGETDGIGHNTVQEEFVGGERVLCTIDWSRCIKESLSASPDASHLAWVEKGEKGQRVLLDAVPGAWHDEIAGEFPDYDKPGLFFSPDGKRFAYRAKRGDKVLLVVDGVEGKEYRRIYNPDFSPDGKHIAYAVERAPQLGAYARECVVTDGEEGAWYDAIEWAVEPLPVNGPVNLQFNKVLFSPDGGHYAYVARVAFEQFVVLDGVKQSAFHRIGLLRFSEDGTELSYNASRHPDPNKWSEQEGMEHFEVVNSEVKRRYPSLAGKAEAVRGIPPGARIPAGVVPQEGLLLIEDTKPGSFGYHVIWNGVKVGLYQEAEVVARSREGKHVACLCTRATTSFDRVASGQAKVVLVDGLEGPEFTRIDTDWVVFSPNGRHIAYAGYRIDPSEPGRSDKPYLVIDRKEFPDLGFSFGRAPVFSTDSSRVALSIGCLYSLGENYGDVTPIGPMHNREYSRIVYQSVVFSPDGKHFAYVAKRGVGLEDIPPVTMAILDGEEGKFYTDILSPPFFIGSRGVRYLALEGPDKVLLVEQEVEQEGQVQKSAEKVEGSGER